MSEAVLQPRRSSLHGSFKVITLPPATASGTPRGRKTSLKELLASIPRPRSRSRSASRVPAQSQIALSSVQAGGAKSGDVRGESAATSRAAHSAHLVAAPRVSNRPHPIHVPRPSHDVLNLAAHVWAPPSSHAPSAPRTSRGRPVSGYPRPALLRAGRSSSTGTRVRHVRFSSLDCSLPSDFYDPHYSRVTGHPTVLRDALAPPIDRCRMEPPALLSSPHGNAPAVHDEGRPAKRGRASLRSEHALSTQDVTPRGSFGRPTAVNLSPAVDTRRKSARPRAASDGARRYAPTVIGEYAAPGASVARTPAIDAYCAYSVVSPAPPFDAPSYNSPRRVDTFAHFNWLSPHASSIPIPSVISPLLPVPSYFAPSAPSLRPVSLSRGNQRLPYASPPHGPHAAIATSAGDAGEQRTSTPSHPVRDLVYIPPVFCLPNLAGATPSLLL
jgi:hypothetical protein